MCIEHAKCTFSKQLQNQTNLSKDPAFVSILEPQDLQLHFLRSTVSIENTNQNLALGWAGSPDRAVVTMTWMGPTHTEGALKNWNFKRLCRKLYWLSAFRSGPILRKKEFSGYNVHTSEHT